LRLAGEVAIVTGATRGLGAVIADVLEAEGARVVRTGRSGADVYLDVRDRASVERAVGEVEAAAGTPTVLVNNAGINRIARADELAEEDWLDVLDTNLTGALRCSQVVGSRMLAAGRGSIVNVASILAMLGSPGRAAYCASKAGLTGLTRALAVDWSGRGVRVNAVCPGAVMTPMLEKAAAEGLVDLQATESRTPSGRITTPADVGSVVAFLASADARSITGQTLVVDGGFAVFGAPAPALAGPAPSRTAS
jgi:3-oxoacyl-[acyl-carrier protein] reductase